MSEERQAPIAEVKTLYATNATNIADMLREMASVVEGATENPTVSVVCIELAENGALEVYGWGDVDNMRALGIMQMASTKVCNQGMLDPWVFQ